MYLTANTGNRKCPEVTEAGAEQGTIVASAQKRTMIILGVGNRGLLMTGKNDGSEDYPDK